MMKNYPDYELSAEDAELLSAYLDDMLDEPERSAFEQRLTDDATLQAELEAWQATITLMNTLPELTAPRDFILTPEMLSRLDTEETPDIKSESKLKVVPRKRKRRTNWLPALSAAAVALVAFGFFAVFTSNNNEAPLAEAGESVAYAVTQVGAADSRTVQNMSVDPLPTLESTADLNLQGASVAQAALFEMDANDSDTFALDDPADGVVVTGSEAPPPAPAIAGTSAPGLDNAGVAADSVPQTAITTMPITGSEGDSIDDTTTVEEEAVDEASDGDMTVMDVMADDSDADTTEAPTTIAGLDVPDESDMASDDDDTATGFFEPESMADSEASEEVMSEAMADDASDSDLFANDVQQTSRNQPALPPLNETQTRLLTAFSQIVATFIALTGAG